jgi:hypothetical protein
MTPGDQIAAPSSKPTGVKWIVALSWLQLVTFAVAALLSLVFASSQEATWFEDFRRGWIRGAGYDPETYGYEQAGEIIGRGLVPAMFPALLLVFVRRRKLTALQFVAGVNVLSLLVSPWSLSLLLTVPTLFLTLLASTKAYCRVNAPPHPPTA